MYFYRILYATEIIVTKFSFDFNIMLKEFINYFFIFILYLTQSQRQYPFKINYLIKYLSIYHQYFKAILISFYQF